MLHDFNAMMQLPHRRHAFGVNAPGLFRHVGFRITSSQHSPSAAADLETNVALRDKIIKDINKELVRIQTKCGSSQILTFCTNLETPTNTKLDRSHTLFNVLPSLPSSLSQWRARIRVDISFEFYFVTFILDQKRSADKISEDGLHEIVRTELELTRATFAHPQTFIDTYYEQLWNAFDAFLGDWQEGFPGDSFTEFRGAALRDRRNPFRQNPDGTRADESFKIPQLDPAAVDASRQSLRRWLARNEGFISEIMQLKHATGNVDRDANCVLCELLDGAAIYCSATRQLDDELTGTKRPLRYFILYNGLSKYQLGRLIRRAHVLGEYRCVAVLDLEKIETASQSIRALGNYIDKLLGETTESATLTDPQLQSIQRSLNKLASSDINGGLLYRVNRSRYYASIFRQAVHDMRPRKLEGWQTYDEFFRRNLYAHFDEIDEVGKRYELLAERVNRLINTRNTEKLSMLGNNIHNLLLKLSDFNAAMVKIQVAGEWIAMAAFAYYGGHIIASLLKTPEFMGLCAAESACEHLMEHSREFFEWLGIVIALVLAGWWRMRWRSAEQPVKA